MEELNKTGSGYGDGDGSGYGDGDGSGTSYGDGSGTGSGYGSGSGTRDRKSTRLNSSHSDRSRMPSSA